jgi:hypothetical protein
VERHLFDSGKFAGTVYVALLFRWLPMTAVRPFEYAIFTAAASGKRLKQFHTLPVQFNVPGLAILALCDEYLFLLGIEVLHTQISEFPVPATRE